LTIPKHMPGAGLSITLGRCCVGHADPMLKSTWKGGADPDVAGGEGGGSEGGGVGNPQHTHCLEYKTKPKSSWVLSYTQPQTRQASS
jgi:hypothetical protein